MQEVSVLFFRHGHALQHQDQSTARGADIDRLIRSIQHQHWRVQRMPVAVVVDGRGREQISGVSSAVPRAVSRIGFHSR